MVPEKQLTSVTGSHVSSGCPIAGYEIHIGRTEGADRARPFARIDGSDEGAVSVSGRVEGTYLHGLFGADAFRSRYLAGLGARASGQSYDQAVQSTLDRLADHLEQYINIDELWAVAGD